MKLLTAIVAALLITTSYASAWNLTGTVDTIIQQNDGAINIYTLRTSDNLLIKNKLILADDPNKQAKLAILLTAKTSTSTVVLDISDTTINSVTIK